MRDWTDKELRDLALLVSKQRKFGALGEIRAECKRRMLRRLARIKKTGGA